MAEAARRATLHLDAARDSAFLARRFVARVLEQWRIENGPRDDALLMTSELVTNAVLHADGSVDLAVEATAPDRIRVNVRDHTATIPAPRRAEPSSATNGRGLSIVAELATTWGVTPADHGKSVWFEVTVPPSAAAR